MKKSDIAIIGISCRFPGANDVVEFWDVISQGRNLFTGIPEERKEQFDFSMLKNPKGAFLENPFHFDNTRFKIGLEEAISMDPQQRIMLELAVEATESACIKDFKNKNTGVFLGANQRAYAEKLTTSLYKNQVTDRVRQLEVIRKISPDIKNELFAELEKIEHSIPLNPSSITGNISNMIASRISHEFNLTGPSLTIDTACSSSLIAVHLACESLSNKECNLAFAGGVNLNLTPSIFLMMEAAQVISATGRCVPFSNESDGILLGEGAGLVLLKRLEDAIKDGDPILSVIKGSGMNNDGHSLGIMTPSWKGQLSLLQSVYSRAGYDPGKISFIEAHGTSTPIGDSIEITVLQRFFSNQKKQLSIGSVKSNIGHLLGASGIAGLIKAVLSINHKKLPPSIVDTIVNPKWKLEETGFKIQDSLEDWENGQIRAAGVSAFGFGGTNAHIILEEPAPGQVRYVERNYHKHQFIQQKFSYDIFPGLKPKDDALYSLIWNEIDLRKSETIVNPDIWLLYCIEEQVALKEKIINSGAECYSILSGAVYSRINEDTFTINSSDENHLRWFFEGLDKTKSYGIIFIPKLEEELSGDKTIAQLLFLKHLFKSATRYFSEPAIWCITSNAFKVFPHEINSAYHHSLATAFGAAVNENTGFYGGILDINGDNISENLDLIAKLIYQNHDHPIIVRNSSFYYPSLSPAIKSNVNSISIKKDGVYLIIGGSSGVGEELAKFLNQKYGCKIIITGTRSVENLSDQLKSLLSDSFEYCQISAFEKDELQSLIENTIQKYQKLNGIVFSAGIMNYGTFSSMSDADFEKTLAVKIKGINILHQVTKNLKIDFAYLISSVSGLSSSLATGMSAYAAANAYLDAFAESAGSPTTPWISVAWSIWEETGMSKSMNSPNGHSMIPIRLSVALDLFEKSIKVGQTNLVAIHKNDATKFTFQWVKRKLSKRETLPDQHIEKETIQTKDDHPDFKFIITKLISEATRIPIAEIDEEESFSSLGLDSISALDIVGQLENEYKFTLNPTLLYEHDSISRLSEYFSNLNINRKLISFPLLPTQKAFYSNQVFYPESPCNSLVKITFEKQLDFLLLQQSWDFLSRNHESLRLKFEMTDNGPLQSVADFSSVKIEYLKLENKSDSVEYIFDVENKMLHKVYQLDDFPLYDLCYVEIGEAESVLIFNAHHIITDAWSMAVLLKELMGIYNTISAGKIPQNESSPLFSQYVNELNSKKEIENKDAKDYWLKELNGFNPFEIPGKNKLNGQIGIETRVYQIVLDTNTTNGIENKAKQETASLFHLLISAYYKILQKNFGQNDLMIRVATANRERSFQNIHNLTGCIADSIPLRVHVDENDGLIEISRQVKNKLHQTQKFNSLASIEYAGLLNSRSQKGPAGITPFGMSYLNTDYFVREDTTKYPALETRAALPFTDLSLLCLKQNGRLSITWNYSTACFSAESIKDLHNDYLQILLDEINEIGPSDGTKETEVLEMPEMKLFPDQNLLHEKVFAACDFYKEKIAINDQGNTLTFSEIKAKSIQLANAIIQTKNAKKEVIGVLEYPGIHAITGILAILASGNAWIPLDPDWPAGRIKEIVAHSEIEIILTSDAHLNKLYANGTEINQIKYVLLSEESITEYLIPKGVDLMRFQEESNETLLPISKSVTPDSLAYIMYTSGTTGIPKGVMVQHRAIEIFLNWISEDFDINSQDKFIQTSSLGFGGSIRQIFSTLLAGGEIHPINRFDLKDPESLLQFLFDNEITILNTVPSVLNSICEYIELLSPGAKYPSLENLRLMLIGGEIFPIKLLERWKKHFGNTQRIVNLYGSTETLVNATFHEIKKDLEYKQGIPVGLPRKGVHVILLDDNGNVAKQGVKAELYVGGPGIAKGYFKNTNLTNERFIVPGILGTQGIYYRTGDLVWKDGLGEYHFLGRNDNQIQLYGHRIEPAEIESVLTSHDLINQAAVLDFKEDTRHWLSAFLVLNDTNQKNSEIDIRKFVSEKLPLYMVPQKIEFIKDMPLTMAGKIDRLTLRRKQNSNTQENKSRIDPTNTQLIIKGIWENVLKIEISDFNHDFFSLGGDSILALEVMHYLRKEFPNTPKPVELFRRKTIYDLAHTIDQLNEDDISKGDYNQEKKLYNISNKITQFPLSITQKGFFILNKLTPDTSPNLVALLPVKGKFDPESFQKAFNFLVERHPMLRTRFIKKQLNTIQEVTSFKQVKIDFIDLCQAPDNKKQMGLLYERYKKLKFDLTAPPLFKLSCFILPENTSFLLLCIHHIIGDAWSMKVLTDELLEVYDQVMEGKNMSLPKLESSYLNLIHKELETQNLSIHQMTTIKSFWKESFRDLPKYELQKHWLLSEDTEQKVTLELSIDEKTRLKDYCANKGISLYQLLFTVFARSLQKVLHVNRLLINTSVSGRDMSISGIENIIGCFARSLPVNVKFSGDDLISNINELELSFLNSSENNAIPPNELIKIYMESGAKSMQSMYRFFISYMDFSALKSYDSKHIKFHWEDTNFFFNAGSVESDMFIGIRVLDNILINFNGITNSIFKNEVKTRMKDDLDTFIKLSYPMDSKPSISLNKKIIDSALIAYFPSLGSLSELFPAGKFNQKIANEFVNNNLPNLEPQILEIETTPFGRTGVVFIPYFADDLMTLSQNKLIESILKGVHISQINGAKHISLAGNLPSKTNYGFAVRDALKKNTLFNKQVYITTGHSCTVVAVVKTISKVLKELDQNVENLSVAVAGFGSIGQASINLLLAEIGHPAFIKIADLAVQIQGLEKSINELKERFTNRIEVIPVHKNVPDEFYSADIIIGASSTGKILEVSKLRSGTILVDDSFPPIIDVKKSILRMKNEQDVLIVGGGKLNAGKRERTIIQNSLPESWIRKVIEKFGDEGLPGCQAESLLMSFDNSLPSTIGLVSTENASIYWKKINELNLGAVEFHLQGYRVDDALVQNIKNIYKMKYGQIGK